MHEQRTLRRLCRITRAAAISDPADRAMGPAMSRFRLLRYRGNIDVDLSTEIRFANPDNSTVKGEMGVTPRSGSRVNLWSRCCRRHIYEVLEMAAVEETSDEIGGLVGQSQEKTPMGMNRRTDNGATRAPHCARTRHSQA